MAHPTKTAPVPTADIAPQALQLLIQHLGEQPRYRGDDVAWAEMQTGERAAPTPAPAAGRKPTDRQIAYAAKLIRRAQRDDPDCDEALIDSEQLSTYTRDQVSAIIDQLK